MQIPGLDLLNGLSQSEDNHANATGPQESDSKTEAGKDQYKSIARLSDRTLRVSTGPEDDGNMAAGVSSSLAVDVDVFPPYPSAQASFVDHPDPIDFALANVSKWISHESSDENNGTSDDDEKR
jgi:hypothetical protein